MIIINNIDNLKQPGRFTGGKAKARSDRIVWDAIRILLRKSGLRQGLVLGNITRERRKRRYVYLL